MIRVSPRLSRVILAAASACLTCAPAVAGQTDAFLKIKGVEGDSGKAQSHDDKHKNQIEILSWSWGETGAADVEYGWKVEEGDSAAGKQLKQDSIAIKQTTHAASRPNDRLRNAGPRDGWGAQSPGEAEITLKGSTIKQNAAPARPSDITLKRGTAASAGGVSVAAGDVTGDGTAAESGLPTGKRQHKPVTISMPLDRGSVSVMLKSAWPDCRVGTQYPELELGDDTKAYELQDAIVTGCAAESVSLNYSKVKVRGWDPEKKEE